MQHHNQVSPSERHIHHLYVRMCANSSIIGNCRIGDNVIIGANSGVKDEDVPDNSIVFGYSPHLIIKAKR